MLWPKFVPRIGEIETPRETRVSYGVMWHEPGPTADLHYMAAVSVETAGKIPAGMSSVDVPAGTYASFAYPLSGLARGFGEIFSRLLPESAYVQAPGPYFERYDEAFDPANPGSLVEICLPVRTKFT
jgi:AraC family transcriptional regulator